MDSSGHSKRIAKNTLYLYLRMAFGMAVSLYTSRIILAKLGIEDFGIYGVINGVIVFFTYTSGSLSLALQRYFSAALGERNLGKLSNTFSASIILHIILVAMVLIIGETLCYWFINSKLNIPLQRMEAMNFLFQFLLIGACVSILSIPYNTLIIANEKMKFYAYISILDIVLKLLIVFLLSFFDFDKLKFFSVLLFFTGLINILCLKIYCKINFKVKFSFTKEKSLFADLLNFSGWVFIWNIVSYSSIYGIGFVVNIFYGVAVNAAMAIADRVNNTVYSFVGNFQVAYQPMLVKSYVSGDRNLFESLFLRGIKMSFFLYFIFSIPLILNMEFILNLWLENPPDQAVIFCKWMLVNFLVVSLTTPLGVAINATGNIKNSIIANSIITSQTIVVSYVFLKFGFAPIAVLVILFVVRFACLLAHIYFMRSQLKFSFIWLWKQAFSKIIAVSLISASLPIAVYFCLAGWQLLLASTTLFILIFLPAFWFIGLSGGERLALRNTIFLRRLSQKQ